MDESVRDEFYMTVFQIFISKADDLSGCLQMSQMPSSLRLGFKDQGSSIQGQLTQRSVLEDEEEEDEEENEEKGRRRREMRKRGGRVGRAGGVGGGEGGKRGEGEGGGERRGRGGKGGRGGDL